MDATPLQFVDSDSWVWFKHEKLAWAPCKVLKGGREVELENGETRERYVAEASMCYPMHASSLSPVSNLVELADLNEASVLHNLRSRYTKGDVFAGVQCDTQMFTYIGPILIYINPYKPLPIFTPELVRVYSAERTDLTEKLPPHNYDVVNRTYLQMRKEGRPQGMVISGESGAGKTEATKICLDFLATVAGSKGDDTPTTLLLDSSPIMESFGNAKTIRNNNSSRFGKYMEIHFKNEGSGSVIVGGVIKKYLLEKSRIVWQAPGERNFHIFVELFDLPPELRKSYALTSPEDYFYINQGGSIRAEGWNDKEEIQSVLAAFKRLGVDATQIFDVVAAILWVGQTTFAGDRSQDTAVSIEDHSAVSRAATLLGLDEKNFAYTLTSRKVKAGRDVVTTPLNYEQACAARDGIAKHVYSQLFDHIAAEINRGVDRVRTGEKGPTTIGVLDIFGFECFAINSFEQLCINYTNEKLQFHFNAHIFLLEMEIYKNERLDVKKITFRDNQGCLDLIEKKRTGVMAMIEEEIYVPKGTDATMLEKMHVQNFGYNDFYAKPVSRGGRGNDTSLSPQEAFIIKHYAGPVPYKVDGFLDKCMDRLPPDSEALLGSSKNELVASFFKDAPGADSSKGGRPATLGSKFKDSMQELYDMLSATSPHFIKCVKPNSIKKNVFDSNFTLYQLTYLGLLEVIRIRKSGYPIRTPDAEFVARYRLLETDPNKWPSSRDICSDHGTEGEWQIGTTMVFMRDAMFSLLETKRAKVMDQRIRGLQGWIRQELVRRAWTRKKKGVEAFQAQFRGSSARKWVGRLRQEVKVERDCERGVQQRQLDLLETAISAATAIGHDFALLAEAMAIVDRLKDEKEVEDMLNYAVLARDAKELQNALRAAEALKLEKLWLGLDIEDPRRQLIPQSRMLIDQLARFDELMAGLAAAMRERTVEALKAMIVECESVELECGELTEARAMLKMAQFEQSSRRLRQEKRQLQIERQWAKKQEAPPAPKPNAAMIQEVAATERKVREFQHALVAAQEHGEAFPGEIHRLETKIRECQQKLASEATKAEGRRQEIERQRAELERAKRTAARKAEVGVLVASVVPGIRQAMATYRVEHLEALVTKVGVRLAGESERSEELGVAKEVLNEMKIATPQATESDALAALKVAIEAGKNLAKPHRTKVKALVVAVGMSLASGLHGGVLQEARQTTEEVLDAWAVTSMLRHATRLGGRTGMACALKRAHENAGFQKYAGSEGREAMAAALGRAAEDGGFRVDEWPTPEVQKELTVRTPGGQIVIHFLDGGSEQLSSNTRLVDAVDQIAAARNLDSRAYGLYQTTRFGTGERLLSHKENEELTLGQVCQDWLKQSLHYAELMGTKSQGDAGAIGDGKYHHRLFFLRKLIFSDSLAIGSPSDTDQLFQYSKKKIANGTFRCSEDDALTLASLRLQIETGDHDCVETPKRLKPRLGSFVPSSVKNSQPAKEWLSDICEIHSRMDGFTGRACKENFIRLVMGQHLWGFAIFKLRQHADPTKPHVNSECVVGVNHRGISFFNSHHEPHLSYPYIECVDATSRATLVHVQLGNGEQLWFQASIAAAQEFVSLFHSYRDVAVPVRKSSAVSLRTVQVTDTVQVADGATQEHLVEASQAPEPSRGLFDADDDEYSTSNVATGAGAGANSSQLFD